MVVKMMRWRPWPPPPPVTAHFEVRLVVRALEGYCDPTPQEDVTSGRDDRLAVEITWNGGAGGRRRRGLMGRRRGGEAVKRNYTREEGECDGRVSWEEEFESACRLASYGENNNGDRARVGRGGGGGGGPGSGGRGSGFLPWIVSFTVFKGVNQQLKSKVSIVGSTFLNLSEFACSGGQKEFQLSLPLSPPGDGSLESPLLLSISLGLVELRASQEALDSGERAIMPCLSPLRCGEVVSAEKDDYSTLKAGLKKVKMLTDYVSVRRPRKASAEDEGNERKRSLKIEDGDYPLDTDSFDDSDGDYSEESNKENAGARKSVSYGTLAYANSAGGANARISGETEGLIYYSNRRLNEGTSNGDDTAAYISEKAQLPLPMRSILSWRKRKLSFRSPKVVKGEPLLKKAYAEEGGDDIDFDRRQLSSDESLPPGWAKADEDSSAHRSSLSEFGEDNFAVGSWEHKEIRSRDGHMKLKTEVFFASIDQRSERAAGESACTALVAVIADWFQTNRELMPIKSQFDTLIRDGSLEWRRLCENETYKERFPDKHFDLDTVLQAQIRPLSVVPGKSFVGFFHPDGMDNGGFDILQGAMSFDNIWDEISRIGSESAPDNEPQLYVVSWNDHFFILKVEKDAYYIIDTLGERLFEGCNQAYILKFDDSAVISRVQDTTQPPDDKAVVEAKSPQPEQDGTKDESPADTGILVPNPDVTDEDSRNDEEEEDVVIRGKDSCKEYIKNFLAAIPMRELLTDIKKGLMASMPLHHRLQIEFHYTRFSPPPPALTWFTDVSTAETDSAKASP
ncbi:hypothetical protein MLD38_020291 [Melastoma candidum]|uniref:Uncharacterized protein n=1 Tax=Melastoma candidum TaxID=119954 RepID=A0ACB9QFH4_9MYRT|nr:hypothetical protein MLD38_020291 [Melastoma candidum]